MARQVKREIVAALADDLADEQRELMDLLRTRPAEEWDRPTPAPQWTVRDQIAHLAHFDGITRMCVRSPEEFVRFRDTLGDLQDYVDGEGIDNGGRSGPEMLAWWRTEADGLRAAALAADPEVRVPWFGPSMSLASKLTARIMETWAHGQDVVDALALHREPSARLRHIARIGVLAFANSFHARGLPVPEADVRVSLLAPDGVDVWAWGSDDADNVVEGHAEDFCLVVTQRRHLEDTTLAVRGEIARRWMDVAQAFAGPPGAGRAPGQFPVRSVTAGRIR